MKDSAVTVALSPHSSPIPSVNAALLLPSSPQVQVVDLGDGEVVKVCLSSKLISQVPKNLFSSATKTLTPIKRKMLSIDTLRTVSKVIGT